MDSSEKPINRRPRWSIGWDELYAAINRRELGFVRHKSWGIGVVTKGKNANGVRPRYWCLTPWRERNTGSECFADLDGGGFGFG